jgi:hypothetical protein
MMNEIDIPEVVAEVKEVHLRYEEALMANDFDVLDELFWDNPRTLRYGPNGTLVSHAAISAFRRSRKGKPAHRVVEDLRITTFGRNFAVTNQESKRPETGVVTRQSQTWIRTPQGWRIVSAHVSDQPAAS